MNALARPLERLLAASFGDWQPVLDAWRRSAAGQRLIEAVDARVTAGAAVYPAAVFRALAETPLASTRVVLLGQDPYHGSGQAEGLAFSVPGGVALPPSLRNIFTELRRDMGVPRPTSGSLLPWARRGVLLLNTSLTVEDGQPGAHAKLGWQALTDAIFKAAVEEPSQKAFLLWGAHAQAKLPLVAAGAPSGRHEVLQSNHPSPLAAARPPLPFIGCGHFGKASRFLAAAGRGDMDWTLP